MVRLHPADAERADPLGKFRSEPVGLAIDGIVAAALSGIVKQWSIRSALDDEALADGLKLRLNAMRERLERIETTSAKKREVALATMEEAGIEKILEAEFTISLRVQPPGLQVTNEADIPEWFWIPQPPKLDRRKVLETIKAGTAVIGAELANSRVNLVVGTK